MTSSVVTSLAAEDFLRDIVALQGKMRMAHHHIKMYEGEIQKTLEIIRNYAGFPYTTALLWKRLNSQREWVRSYENVAKKTLEAIMIRKQALLALGWKG